jgi:DNA polymerase III epsilon subunit-like protein
MLKFKTILQEMIAYKLPAEKILNYFLNRIDNTFIFFDTETTGTIMTEPGRQIVEIAAIATNFNGDTLRFFEVGRFEIKIKLSQDTIDAMQNEPDAVDDLSPEKYPTDFGYRINTRKQNLKLNRYNFDDSTNYDDEEIALDKFVEFIDSYDDVVLIAHNTAFDIPWVNRSQKLAFRDIENFDTLRFFQYTFFPALKKLMDVHDSFRVDYDKFLDNTKKIKGADKVKPSSAMEVLVKTFANDVNQLLAKHESGAHSALTDVEMTIEVFERGLNLIRSMIKD